MTDFPQMEIHSVGDRLYATITQKMDRQIRQALFMYSEWLDSEELIVDEKITDDKRTHEELVRDFIASLGGQR